MSQTTRIQFLLKIPKTGGRATFSITKRILNPGQKARHETIKMERLDALNAAYKQKVLSLTECEIYAKELIQEFYEAERRNQPTTLHNNANQRLLKQYWDSEYSTRNLKDPKSAWNRLTRAIEAVGSLSIRAASREELQRAVDRSCPGNKQRAVVSTLNQLLAWAKTGIKLRRHYEEFGEVRYLTLNEFEQMLTHIEDPTMRLLHTVAFATGGRVGEIFAMTLADIKADTVFIGTQIDRQLKRRGTKNRKSRRAAIIPRYTVQVIQWASVPFKEREALRNKAFSRITKKACLKAFPNQPVKHCVFHDLRHSYAMYLADRGVNVTLIAKNIGDSVVVVEKFYAGRDMTDEQLEMTKQKLK